MNLRRDVLRFVVCAAVLIAVVAAYRHVTSINPTTVAFTFLVAILIVSAAWGLRYAVFLAVFATLALNYYFLPPIGTFRIAETQNWVALLAFLATAVVASQLSERARSEAQQAAITIASATQTSEMQVSRYSRSSQTRPRMSLV